MTLKAPRRGILALLLIAVAVSAGYLLHEDEPTYEWTERVFRGVALESRVVAGADGDDFLVAKGTVQVPEVRGKADSRMINIGYMVVPGIEGAGEIPIVMVAGGPGGSHIADIHKSWVQRLVRIFRRVGDVVMVDLRGINSSGPAFEVSGASNKLRNVASGEDYLQLQRDIGAANRAQLIADGFDLSGYVVTEAAADVIAVADALGYGKLNLYGTSFGSHFTFTTARVFPDRVNRFLVTGLEGYDHTYDDGVAVLDAVRQIAREAETVWDGAYGVENPLEALLSLAARAEEDPASAHGLAPYEVEYLILYGSSYDFGYQLGNRSSMKSWPADVAKIMAGERLWRLPFARRLTGFYEGKSPSDAAVGLFDCSSHISQARQKRLTQTAPESFPNNSEYMNALCAGWDVTPLPPEFQQGTISQVPTLFVHGTYDTSTPYPNAVEMLEQFPNASLVTVYGGSHGALWEALSAHPPLADEIVGWFQGEAPPPDVTLGPIPFDPLER